MPPMVHTASLNLVVEQLRLPASTGGGKKKRSKFLKFKTQEGDIVEIRGAEGLNYRITQL